MPEKQNYIEQPSVQLEELLEKISAESVSWEKSKEQVWSEIEERIDAVPETRTMTFFSPWLRLAAAAVIVLIAGISVFIQLYTKQINIPAGQQTSIDFPDHSKVKMNALSSLSYKPVMWKFSRKMKFEGEGYFDVKEGKKFEVISGKASTIVLGTSFNIYSRNEEYRVTCVEGTVKVVENTGAKEILLEEGQKAELSSGNEFKVEAVNTDQALSWMSDKFSFTSTPLDKVFQEIERQYGIKIIIPPDIDYIYTGSFEKSPTVENVLNLVCKPFSLVFSRKSNDEYIISRKN